MLQNFKNLVDFLPIAKKWAIGNGLYSPMVDSAFMKFDWDQIETVGVGFWNFQPLMALCQTVIYLNPAQASHGGVSYFHFVCPSVC